MIENRTTGRKLGTRLRLAVKTWDRTADRKLDMTETSYQALERTSVKKLRTTTWPSYEDLAQAAG
jgi:hypothetical protein